MADTICLVVANQVLENQKVSFKFMGDARIPDDFYPFSEIFGVITLKDRDPNSFNPFNIGRRPEEKLEESEKRWNINVFEAGKGLLIASGFDQDPEEKGLSDALGNEDKIPDCVLLTHIEALEPIRKVCQTLGIDLLVHEFNGILATS